MSSKRLTVVKMKFGSHLYGMDTPESDTDYKGVFLPTRREMLLGQVPKNISTSTGNQFSKNSNEDVDTELFSLHEFIKLACEGQTIALDMLHAPPNMLLENSIIWAEIVSNRKKFYTRNLRAFVGYARRQAAKYGVKGSRLDAAREVKDFLEQGIESGLFTRLEEVWNKLPTNDYCYFMEDSPNGIKQYQVCGRILQSRSSLETALQTVDKFHTSYGERAKQAANNEGIDWKAISHALRAAYQVEQLLTEGTITYPLREAPYLKKVKRGERDYQTEVGPHLEEMMEHVEMLSLESDLPDKVDRKFWDDYIVETMETYVVH